MLEFLVTIKKKKRKKRKKESKEKLDPMLVGLDDFETTSALLTKTVFLICHKMFGPIFGLVAISCKKTGICRNHFMATRLISFPKNMYSDIFIASMVQK